MPERIQLKRTKGWRKPDNTVVVSRPTKWGNPFNWKMYNDKNGLAKYWAKENFKTWITGRMVGEHYKDQKKWILEHINELRDKNLACWCKPGEPCHADILLKLANDFCNCKLPGFDVNNPNICPTCGMYQRDGGAE